MKAFPIVSKQIAYVNYDDQASQMIVQYHAGYSEAFSNVAPADFQKIMASTNRYDSIVKLTGQRLSLGRGLAAPLA